MLVLLELVERDAIEPHLLVPITCVLVLMAILGVGFPFKFR